MRTAIHEATRGRTTIIIAHRLSTILSVDEVAVIEDGQLVEQGPLADLMAREGRFAALFRTGFGTEDAARAAS